MKIVKLTYNFNWPLFRQTPGFSQVWGDYKFVISDHLTECDFWIIYTNYRLAPEKVKCSPENVVFIPGECYSTSPTFSRSFLKQFGLIVTVQRELKHGNILYSHNANPWFINKTYDELISPESPAKSKLISVVTSDKAFTEGHRKRLEFIQRLKSHFGARLDLFGRGLNEVNDKWSTLADYKYSIAIENDFCDDWVTEKFFDCLYAEALPFYYGCPNLAAYVNEKSFVRIDLNDFQKTVAVIEDSMQNDVYSQRRQTLSEEKARSLNRDQFFPFIVTILDQMDSSLAKKTITLKTK